MITKQPKDDEINKKAECGKRVVKDVVSTTVALLVFIKVAMYVIYVTIILICSFTTT